MSALNATVFALQYGAPLAAFAQAITPFIAQGRINTLRSTSTLSNSSSDVVIEPNVDTLYSLAAVDLAESDVVLTVPAFGSDRYYNFAIYDPYGGNFANLGSITGVIPGDYLLRRAVDVDGKIGVHSASGCNDTYQAYINAPTTDSLVVLRALVKNNGSDLEYVQSVQTKAVVKTTPRLTSNKLPAPALSAATLAGVTNSSTDPHQLLELLSRLSEGNPPYGANNTADVAKKLHEAGIRNGSYVQPSGLNLTHAATVAEAAIAVGKSSDVKSLGNGWIISTPQGSYGSNYIDRTVVAEQTYLENAASEALYPISKNSLSLTASQSYKYTFSSKPPVLSNGHGFWSLTMYNSKGYLVANDLNIYAVGDRSNITHADGSTVYTNATSSDTDKQFEVLVQDASVPPPSNWTSNWLPAPSNESDFEIVLRLYGPTDALTNGSWIYPTVTKGSAITA